MKAYSYKGDANKYLFIPKKDEFSRVPKDVLTAMGTLDFFREVDLDSKSGLIALDQAVAKNAIAEKGYYVIDVEIKSPYGKQTLFTIAQCGHN